ncbi:50S ribosomal protein L32 [Candidatus Marinamargulisbacteria bacterium SCGC AG-343-D04]|nr:50S ribosomal protein L32 [Candidatus Marinamargulisbacteria bacterium SCGC AG-343-D04]
MAVPKRRRSKARKRTHKSLWKINVPTLVKCTNCDEYVRPHHACTACGFYKGKQVLTIKVKEKPEKES